MMSLDVGMLLIWIKKQLFSKNIYTYISAILISRFCNMKKKFYLHIYLVYFFIRPLCLDDPAQQAPSVKKVKINLSSFTDSTYNNSISKIENIFSYPWPIVTRDTLETLGKHSNNNVFFSVLLKKCMCDGRWLYGVLKYQKKW